jgi:hypothetical protein
MKRMIKENTKKNQLMLLSFAFLFVVLVSVSLVSAQFEFFERWYQGSVGELDAKILLLILVAVIILSILISLKLNAALSAIISIVLAFVITAFVTPDAVIGIFKSYEPVSLTIATLIPLLIFFALTGLAAYKGSRTLITVQLITWGIFFLYIAGKSLIALIIALGWIEGWTAINVPDFGTAEASYYWISTIITLIVAGIMTFSNGWFMNFAVKHLMGVKSTATQTDLDRMKRGMKTLRGIGKETEGG